MSGKVPSGDVRLTLNIRRELHRKLKMAGVITGMTMGELVEKCIERHLDELLRKGLQ